MSLNDELQLHVRLKAHLAEAAKAARAIDDIKDETRELSRETMKVNTEFSSMLNTMKIGAGLSGSFLAVQGITELLGFMSKGIQLGIKWNATLETTQQGFEVLLGSAEEAQERVDELIDFTARTPFQQADVLNANRLLEALTKGALSSAEGMLLVGDAAAASNRSLQETAMWVGRLYAGLQTGTPVGEATLRLIEMGLVGGDVAQELNALASEAHSNAEAMEILQRVFGDSAGAMQKQSETLNGMLSTLRDTMGEIAGEASKPLFDSLKNHLRDLLIVLGKVNTQADLYVKTLQKIPDATKAAAMDSQMNGGGVDWLDEAAKDLETITALREKAAAIAMPTAEEYSISYGPGGASKTKNLDAKEEWEKFRETVMESFPEAFKDAEEITYTSWRSFVNSLGDLWAEQSLQMKIGQYDFGDMGALSVAELEARKKSLEGEGVTIGQKDARELELVNQALEAIKSRNLELEAQLPKLRKEYEEQNQTLERQLELLDQKIVKTTESLQSLDTSNMTDDAADAAVLALVIELNTLMAEREEIEKKITAEKQKQQQALDKEFNQQQKQLESLRNYLASEEESIQQSYERRKEMILSNTLATEQERADLMTKLEADRSEKMAELDRTRWQTATSMFGDFQNDLLVAAQSGNKELVGIYKTAAIAVTIMQTYQAAQSAFAAWAGLGPWGVALGTAAAAAAIVAGMARVSAIQSQGFAEGGYTGFGGKYEYAGPAHKGEVIWSQEDVRRAGGVARAENLRVNAGRLPQSTGGAYVAPATATAASGGGSASSGSQQVSIAIKTGQNEGQLRDWLESQSGKKILLDAMKDNQFSV